MNLEYKLTVRDPLHGNMHFTCLEKDLIDSPFFQRLRGLKQSSLSHYTYPTALTTRFEHSLGTAHTAGKIVEHALSQSRKHRARLLGLIRQDYETFGPPESNEDLEAIVVQAVRLAALLHDVGHLPFSHCFEEELVTCLESSDELAGQWGSTHFQEFRDLQGKLKETVGELKLHEYLTYMIVRDHPDIKARLNYQPLLHTLTLDILLPPSRMSDRSHYLNAVLGRIVHGEIDADRMDFIRRDAGMTGSGHGAFDIERVIECLSLARIDGHLELLPSARGISVLEAFFISRLEIYRWQYHHHNVIFYDLLLRIVVGHLLRGDLSDHMDVGLVPALSTEYFLESEPIPIDGLRWNIRDDGLIWSILQGLHTSIYEHSRQKTLGALEERLLVCLEELLLRRKRHVAIWKDSVGFGKFQAELHAAFVTEIETRFGKSHDVASKTASELTAGKEGEPDQRLMVFILERLSDKRGLQRIQEWLWDNQHREFLLDFRAVQPFRRLEDSNLSLVRVCGRGADADSSRPMTELSDVLDGLSGTRFKKVRLFAYVILPYDVRLNPESHGEGFVEESCRALAKAVARWALESPFVIPAGTRQRLEIQTPATREEPAGAPAVRAK